VQNPPIMGQLQIYTAIAANADKHIYALQDGATREFTVAPDGVIWTYVGVVGSI